jgi:FlaA1/EpsC-like NDP-sugar epimerase
MKANLFSVAGNQRAILIGLIYTLILCGSHWAAWELRFDFAVPANFRAERLASLFPLIAVKLLLLVALRQFNTMLTYFSLPDLLRVVWAMSTASFLGFLVGVFAPLGLIVPRGVLLIDLMLSVASLCTFRLALRLLREQRGGAGSKIKNRRRVAIVGAGSVGANLARECASGRARGLLPVVFMDDDPQKRGGFVHGIRVAGRPDEVEAIRERYGFDQVILAIPSAPEKRVREIITLMAAQGLAVDTVPSIDDLTSGRVKVSKIRPVDVEDLLGREAVQLDSAGIAASVKDQVVMVTGAGGSIGSELCRQIAACNPSRLLLVEQSEGALFLIEQELFGAGFGGIIQPIVADILDRPRIRQVLERYKPARIYHAAAHKHVYLMERQPAEAVKNNALGTLLLAEEAIAHGVQAFVFISTDKAINPTSVMGASKRLAELALRQLHVSGKAGATRLMAVRFGNVLGSSGSVVPIFKRQIAEGGPVTVTHPEVTRYFMTIPEAVGLVLQASVLGEGGEIFVLDMGNPVKIADLARQMIQLSGLEPDVDIEIKFIGLKPGEKLYEELQHHTEQHVPTTHPRIRKFVAPSEATLAGVHEAIEHTVPNLHRWEANEVKSWLNTQIPEYTPYVE